MLPTAFIDLDAVVWNYLFLCDKARPAQVGAVLKANAYGLGMKSIALALYRAGCRLFFTAHMSEALELRKHIKNAAIIVLHGVEEKQGREALDQNIIPMLNHLGAIEIWRQLAHQSEKTLSACVHLDTGMNRLGLSDKEQRSLIENPKLLARMKIKAWVSHFACADEFDNPMTPRQRDHFIKTLGLLPKAPISLCNSSGLFWGAQYVFDIVRPGIALYGGNPTPHLKNPMRSVVEVKAPILQVREVNPKETVGYAATYRMKRKGRLATIALGYADGYPRVLSNRGEVKIGNFFAPLVGRISMDLMTIDVTDIPEGVAHCGAMVTLIGPHRSIDQVAVEAGTIPYEILTSLGSRVLRSYKDDSEWINQENTNVKSLFQ